MPGKVDALRTIVSVAEGDVAVGHDKSDGRRPVFVGFIEHSAPASTRIDNASVAFVRSLRSHNVSTGAETRISKPILLQFLKVLQINIVAFALPDDVVVPRQTKPLQVVLQLLGKRLARTVRVEILNAQKPTPSLAPG